MHTIVLSGVGGSTNWLPLVFPLAALAAMAWGLEWLSQRRKRRRLERENRLINDVTAEGEALDNSSQGF